jgi:predicted metal-binding protein
VLGETLAMPVPLFVCRSCRPDGWKSDGPRPGSLLVGEVERVVREKGLSGSIAVLPIHCLAHCAHACAAAVLPPDGRKVVFDGLAATSEVAEALVSVANVVRTQGSRGVAPDKCPHTLLKHRREL